MIEINMLSSQTVIELQFAWTQEHEVSVFSRKKCKENVSFLTN